MSEKQILHGKGPWADAETDGLGGADVSSRFFFFFLNFTKLSWVLGNLSSLGSRRGDSQVVPKNKVKPPREPAAGEAPGAPSKATARQLEHQLHDKSRGWVFVSPSSLQYLEQLWAHGN